MWDSRWEPPEDAAPVCPVCFSGLGFREVVVMRDGEVVGCTQCLDTLDAFEWANEQAVPV